MQSLILLTCFVVSILGQVCTLPPPNVINTGAELGSATVGSPYMFTCVAGSTADGNAGGPTTLTLICTTPGANRTAQWGNSPGCILYPNFCASTIQSANRLTPASGGILGQSATFTCAAGHSLAWATYQGGQTYQRVAAHTTNVVCASFLWDIGTATFVNTGVLAAAGVWAGFDPQGNYVPVYCEAIADFCPQNAYPFPSVLLTANEELQFTTSTRSYTKVFETGPTTVAVSARNPISATSFANCQYGFTTSLSGFVIPSPAVSCLSVTDYVTGGGRWTFDDAPTVTASCVKTPNYCSTINFPGNYVNKIQLFPEGNNFLVDSIPTATNLIPNGEAQILCFNGYGVYPNDRTTSLHPLHCVPEIATHGAYKFLDRSIPPAATYTLTNFLTQLNGQDPCQKN